MATTTMLINAAPQAGSPPPLPLPESVLQDEISTYQGHEMRHRRAVWRKLVRQVVQVFMARRPQMEPPAAGAAKSSCRSREALLPRLQTAARRMLGD